MSEKFYNRLKGKMGERMECLQKINLITFKMANLLKDPINNLDEIKNTFCDEFNLVEKIKKLEKEIEEVLLFCRDDISPVELIEIGLEQITIDQIIKNIQNCNKSADATLSKC